MVYGDSVDPTCKSISRFQKIHTNKHMDDLVIAVVWSSLEIQIAMITVCFPALRRLLAHFFPGLLGSTSGTTTNNLSSKAVTNDKVWHSSRVFGTNSTLTTAASKKRDTKEDLELQDNMAKVDGTFYISNSAKRRRSIDSVEPLVTEGVRYNITTEIGPEKAGRHWRKV